MEEEKANKGVRNSNKIRGGIGGRLFRRRSLSLILRRSGGASGRVAILCLVKQKFLYSYTTVWLVSYSWEVGRAALFLRGARFVL